MSEPITIRVRCSGMCAVHCDQPRPSPGWAGSPPSETPRLERWYTCPDCGQSIRVAVDSITIAGDRHWLPELGELGEHLTGHAKAYAGEH